MWHASGQPKVSKLYGGGLGLSRLLRNDPASAAGTSSGPRTYGRSMSGSTRGCTTQSHVMCFDMLSARKMLGDQSTQYLYLSHNLTTPVQQAQNMICSTERGAGTHWHVCVQSGQPCSLHRHLKVRRAVMVSILQHFLQKTMQPKSISHGIRAHSEVHDMHVMQSE